MMQQPDSELSAAPLGGTRAEALQRLQIGLGGLAGVIVLVGLASTITERARESEAAAVPNAAATVAAEPAAPVKQDPLAEVGAVPEVPDQPGPEAGADAELEPETGAIPPLDGAAASPAE